MVSRQHTRSVAAIGITDRVFAGTGDNSVDGVGADFHWRLRSCRCLGRLGIALAEGRDRLLGDFGRTEHERIETPSEFGQGRKMFFVINKSKLQGALSIVRDDRRKKTQGSAGPFLRMEANDNFVKLDGNHVSAMIPATVYEPGVLFLRATVFRRMLTTFKKRTFLTVQVMSAGMLIENVTLSLEDQDMLLYVNPDQAPRFHPSVKLKPLPKVSKPIPKPKPKPTSHQLFLWDTSPTFPTGADTLWNKKGVE